MRTIVREQGPRFEFDLAFRDQLKGGSDYAPTNWQRDLERSQDLAYAVQRELEAALLHVTRWLHAQTRSQNLVLSGGVALNCVANARILAETPFERVFIPPPAGDDGIAIGCAFFGWLVLGRGAKTFALTHPYYGKTYAGERVRAALEREVLVDFSQPESLETFVAAQLASGKVLGWFQGASALGPRALGDRSILGDPRDPHLRDRLNLRVKHREPFRPYGASVLAESAAEYFAVWDDWPYMNMAVAVREEKKAAIPAVVHVDGSCRIQTVRRSDHPRFHRLLQEFHRRTGVPLILNTSFNRQGEPIVETPEDALRSFLNMELDGLVLEGYWAVSRLTDDSREAEELVRGCRLIVERAFDVVQHLYPDGVRECTARLPPPDHASGVSISHHVEQLLVHLDRAVSLRAAFRRLGIRRGSPDATAVTRELLKLHRLGWIRLTHVPGCSPGAQP
jgi:predicted NodU family carbamoyl transferase